MFPLVIYWYNCTCRPKAHLTSGLQIKKKPQYLGPRQYYLTITQHLFFSGLTKVNFVMCN